MNIIQLKNRLFQKYLMWQANSKRIKRKIHKERLKKIPGKEKKIKDNLTVAAIQLKMNLYQNPLAFVEKMHQLVKDAIKSGAEVIVFPEYNLMQLLGVLPGIEGKDLTIENLLNKDENLNIKEIISFISPVIERVTLYTFSHLAGIYQVYIMAGSGLFLTGNDIYNQALLFGPGGNLLARQNKTHLMPMEVEWGVKEGDRLESVDTKWGNLAFPICMDATYFETFRILQSMNVEIVLLPIANPEAEYNYWTAMRGIWSRVQESKLYGVKSAMVGSFLGYKLTGQAGIYAPLEITPAKDGILVEASSYDKEEVVTAKLDLALLNKFSIKTINRPDLWKKYFPQIYYFFN